MGNPGHGIFIISLDFELYWGVRDVVSLEDYRENLLGVRRAVPRILETFREYDIHATWAAVGFLLFPNKAELLAGLPEIKPEYTDSSLCPYRHLDRIGEDEADDPFHYAPSLADLICRVPGQELGTHTLSHYYCLESGQDSESFRHDLQSAMRIARCYGQPTRSLVFPRNQVNPDYLETCAEMGITGYRGTERSWLYASRNYSAESQARRALRLIDAYVNLSGHHAYPVPDRVNGMPVNLPSSRFLRPFSRTLALLEPLRQRRIEKDLAYAARERMVYHLWWHPHNFGRETELNIGFLRRVLDKFSSLRDSLGMRSMNMGEAAALCV